MNLIATLILLLALSAPLFADEREGDSKKSLARESTHEGELVPKTLEDAHYQLEKLLSKKELAKIDAMESEDEMAEYHFGLGMGIRNSWGLWQAGPLAQHMNQLGFRHPDDMSEVILGTFWCKRHKRDFV